MSAGAKFYLGLVVFACAGSLASRVTGLDPGWIAPITALITLGTGVALVTQPFFRARGAGIVALVLLIGAASEISGLYTGLPFGRYAYTGAWWPSVTLPGGHFFPLQLPFAWLMMTAGGYLVFAFRLRGLAPVILGAALVTAIDVPMEWTLTRVLGYWEWLDPAWPIGELGFGVPLMNSVGWFVTALAGGLLLSRVDVEDFRGAADDARVVLAGHLALMVVLALVALIPARSA